MRSMWAHMSKAIATCEGCNGPIRPQDVHTTLPIKRSPQHVALVYNCALCKLGGRIAAEVAAWESIVAAENSQQDAFDKTMRAAVIELNYVNDVGDLLALWASYGPPRMEVAKPCYCTVCENRRKMHGSTGS